MAVLWLKTTGLAPCESSSATKVTVWWEPSFPTALLMESGPVLFLSATVSQHAGSFCVFMPPTIPHLLRLVCPSVSWKLEPHVPSILPGSVQTADRH